MVYILVGKIASGKTTWAKQKCQEEKAVILSHDDLMLLLEDTCEGRAAHVEQACRISLYFAKLCEQFESLGMNGILDYGFWTVKERELIQTELQKRNIPFEMLYITCEEAVRIERLKKRNEVLLNSSKREYVISDELREKLDGFFEEPTEEHISIVRMDS